MLYTELKKKEKEIKELTDLGVVSYTVMRDIEIFEKFHEYDDVCKICRYEVLADVYGFKTSSSIEKIIMKLSRKSDHKTGNNKPNHK